MSFLQSLFLTFLLKNATALQIKYKIGLIMVTIRLTISLTIGYNNANTCIIGIITKTVGVITPSRMLNKKYKKSKLRCPSFTGNLLFSLIQSLLRISFIP